MSNETPEEYEKRIQRQLEEKHRPNTDRPFQSLTLKEMEAMLGLIHTGKLKLTTPEDELKRKEEDKAE